MQKISVLLAALVVTTVPVFAAVPAYAADSVICVGSPVGPCTSTASSISAAIVAASGNAVDDTIFVGPGTYSDGPYPLDGNAHALTLKGSGPATVITLPAGASQAYVTADHAAVRNLKIVMNGTTSDNDTGLYAYDGGTAQNVTVDGAAVSNANGAHVKNAQLSGVDVQMKTGAGTVAMYGEGGAVVTDSTLVADTAFEHSGTGTPDKLSRVALRVGTGAGVDTDSGTVSIDDSLVDLGSTGSVGLQAANFNNSTSPRAINADQVTIVGGKVNSSGAWAFAGAQGALQHSTLSLTNSIVRGPATSLVVDADNNGSQGGPSVASITVSHTDYSSTGGTIGAHGSGGVVAGAGNVNVDPAFVNAAAGNFHLSSGSPVIDKGATTTGPLTDLDGHARTVDGNGDGIAIRDLGAYELPDKIAPNARFTKKPAKRITSKRAKFGFASEPGARFQCRLDNGAWKVCTSPRTVAVKKGAHVFRVRALDRAGNVDPSPAAYRFRRR